MHKPKFFLGRRTEGRGYEIGNKATGFDLNGGWPYNEEGFLVSLCPEKFEAAFPHLKLRDGQVKQIRITASFVTKRRS